MDILTLAADVLIILGALVFAVCGVGLITFRDIYTRLSVIGTAGGIGIVLVVLGVLLHNPDWLNTVKALAIIVLLVGTSSIGSILLARAALLRRTPMVEPIFDETKLLSEENPE
ncbi:monovalent cation/H(+) antiporter subunit G [Corynebacterium halotolerans]|uniref:Monovalent cation/H+ antiporter subunit G n=1 Tax=Corynebacterium halotolerans YIM 70093 = DSM 44683 TaxID=1121362 RepID=M1NTK3_9CORY|nr:monovalent cation/H(+) antiporter subunit G [Corynebacterium halotolerans]AGF72807.1 hypothetical protein A605_09025 [Corynebacterium halotolerans YIM 70093 = DSM 44683]